MQRDPGYAWENKENNFFFLHGGVHRLMPLEHSRNKHPSALPRFFIDSPMFLSWVIYVLGFKVEGFHHKLPMFYPSLPMVSNILRVQHSSVILLL
jgi:hypothetical protein